MPSDEDTLGDKDRIIKALEEKYTNVVMPYNVVKTLYPMCRNSSFKITVTMIKKEYNWLITKVESGNTSKNHYGLAVDLGSTTIIMQLVDLNNGQVIAEESTFNKQIKYGEDILSRIFYTKQYEDGLKAECNEAATPRVGKSLVILPFNISSNFDSLTTR